MQVNMFAGARRIGAIIGVVWIAGCIAYALNQDTYGRMLYLIPAPGEGPLLVERCFPDDAERHKLVELDNGSHVSITLCFAAHPSSDGQRLIPYALKTTSVRFPDGTVVDGIPEGMTRAEIVEFLRKSGYTPETLIGPSLATDLDKDAASPKKKRHYLLGAKFSPEVTAYLDAEETKFSLPPSDVQAAIESSKVTKLELYKSSGFALILGLLLGWLSMVAIGWVARGFLNIPRGADAPRP